MDLRLVLSVGMMIGGLVFGIGGCIFSPQKFVRGADNATEVEIPYLGELRQIILL
jgi:hypothetical protein